MMKDKEIKNLVVIGGGFAGVALAKKLESLMPSDWEIYLLSKTNFITYNPLLPEVIGASILPGHVQAPIRLILKRTRIRMVTVESIDYENQIVHYRNDRQGSLQFNQLVHASGVKASMDMLPGLKDYTLPLKTVGDALYIRNRIIERLEQATIHPDSARRKQLTSFVVLGGGFSGVETAGELEDFLRSAQRYYKNVRRDDCKVTLIHGTDRILPELPEQLSKTTHKNFIRRKINVLLQERAVKIEPEKVVLESGKEIEGATIICTIGTSSNLFVGSEILPNQRGKLLTKADMSIEGHDGLWAIGDCAIVPNSKSDSSCPPTAQFANQQAKILAKNIVSKIKGYETFAFGYKPIGLLASIGHNKAVAQIFGMRFSGLIGFMMWRGVYLLKVPTLARKIRLFLEWNWSMFFPPDIAHLGFKRSSEE